MGWGGGGSGSLNLNKSAINKLECSGKKQPTNEIADTFNTFFSKIGPKLSKEIHSLCLSVEGESTLLTVVV